MRWFAFVFAVIAFLAINSQASAAHRQVQRTVVVHRHTHTVHHDGVAAVAVVPRTYAYSGVFGSVSGTLFGTRRRVVSTQVRVRAYSSGSRGSCPNGNCPR